MRGKHAPIEQRGDVSDRGTDNRQYLSITTADREDNTYFSC
jgi:hypothetical protein